MSDCNKSLIPVKSDMRIITKKGVSLCQLTPQDIMVGPGGFEPPTSTVSR
jgi:hypothetical protein